MPSDRASLAEAIATLVDVGDATYDLINTDGPSVIARLDQIAAAYAGQDGQTMAAPNQSPVRLALRNQIASYRTMMTSALLELAKADGVDVEGTPSQPLWWHQIREWMEDDNYYATGRGWTRGSEPSVTNLNTYRLLTDQTGESVETGYPQVITTEVQRATGNQASPQVRIYGEPAGLDQFELLGNGFSNAIAPFGPGGNNSGNLLSNSSLVNDIANAGDIASADISSWTLNADDEWQADTAKGFGNLTRCIGTDDQNAYIEQSVVSGLRRDVPYLPVVAVYLDSVGSGNAVTINWGGKSQTFSSVTNSQWVVLAPDRDGDLWLDQFDDATNGGRIRVTFAGSSGTLSVGWVGWVPMTRLGDFAWWACVLGDSNPLAGASATTTDSLSANATLNHVLPLLYPTNPNAYLRTSSDTGSTQIADLT
jgi:hypothetical protein